jgi:transposase
VSWVSRTRQSKSARKELTEHGSQAFPSSGHQVAQEEEVRRLKRELEIVKQERDVLKKAISIFSRERQ